jgi:outer membrane lipoprotein SlyB
MKAPNRLGSAALDSFNGRPGDNILKIKYRLDYTISSPDDAPGIDFSPGRGTCSVAMALTIGLVLLSGCAGSRPVLYPNAKLSNVGQAQAEQDINECMALAEASGAGSGKAADAAQKTAGAAAVGGASGAAVGAIGGHAGRGAARGSAGAAAGSLTRSLLKSREPTNLEKRFVDQCLHDRGYKTIGWK